MKKLLTLLLLLLFFGNTWAQGVASYSFAASSGSFTAITGGTVLGAGTIDDNLYNANNIGFTFTYQGTSYTQFSVNANGWLCMGATAVNSYTPISSGTSNNVISAVGRDLQGLATGELSYKVLGSSPTRSLVVQWLHFAKYGTTGAGDDWSFQIILNETSNTINLVYGTFTTNITSTTVQVGLRGSSNADFNNRSTTTSWASTTAGTTNAASCTLSNTVYPASGQIFTYTPPGPCAAPSTQPTVLNLTPTLNSITGSFTAASGVDDYLVVRSLSSTLSATPVDGTRYPVGSSLGGGVVDYYGTGTSFTSSSLASGTLYYYFVFSANDATCLGGPKYLTSSPLTNNTITLTPGSITAIATGNWSATTTWSTGLVPTASDNVTISGYTVSVDVATAVCYNLTINSGATLNSTGTAGILTVNANLTNDGILDLWTSVTQSSGLVFTSASNNSFYGTGSTTNLSTLTVNKGTSKTFMLEMNLSNFSNQGVSSGSLVGFLNLTNGTLKVSGTNTYSGNVFTSAAYSIGSTTGFWLNNPNFTVLGQNGSPTLSGLFRISGGTFNIGNSSGNSMGFSAAATVTIEGGNVIAAGRFGVATSTNAITYSQSGGSVTVCTVGNTSTSLASFDLGTATTTVMSLTGGSINLQLASTAASTPRDFRTPIGIYSNYTGTTLYLGNASSGTSKTYSIAGSVPPMVFTTTSAVHKAALSASTYYYGDLIIPAGSDLNLNGFGFWFLGTSCLNDGSITATTASSRFDFANGLLGSLAPQDYSGTGTFGSPTNTSLSLGINNSNGITLNAAIYVLRVNLFLGALKNANLITIGNGTTGSCYVQVGVSGATSSGGSFDVSPVYNLGTGTFYLLYEPEATPRTTGFEIPPSRSITHLSINNVNGVTLSGGNLTLGSAGILYMTSGKLYTSAGNALALTNTTSTAISGGSSLSYVDGPMSRTFAANVTAIGTFTSATLYPIGKGSSYLPIWIDPSTSAGGTVVVNSEAFTSNSGTGGSGVSGLSADRWEAVITSGGTNLVSSFLQIGDPAIVSGNQILQASAGNGVYGSIPSASTFTAGTPNTLKTTGSQIPASSYFGYFAYGNLTPCSAPGNQPTSLVASYITSTGFTGSFTAATSLPSHYLVVRYASGGAPTAPVDYTNYAVGAVLGTGTVVLSSTLTTFTQTGLTTGVTYDYYIYSYNNSGCWGPIYLTSSPLFGSVTLCATAVGTPGTPTSSNVQPVSFDASWTASTTPGVTYILDVATNSAFTSFVAGYELLNVGAALTWPVSGLTASTLYYVRVRANSGGTCYSVYSSTLTVKTPCNPSASLPWTESFDAMTTIGNSILPDCWLATSPSGTPWYSGNAASVSYNDPCSAPYYVYVSYSPSSADKFLITPGFTLTAGTPYDFKFKWVGDGYAGWTGDILVNTAQTGTGATALGTSFVVAGTTTTVVCSQVTRGFTPSATGTYYFMVRVNNTGVPWYLGFDDFSLDLTPPEPAISVVPTSLAFGYVPSGGTSIEKTYSISGLFLTPAAGDITITPPANFEISTTLGGPYSSVPITLGYTGGTLAAQTIYAVFKPTSSGIYYTGNIANSGGGAPIANVAVTGNSDLFASYCASSASNAADEEIFSVTVNGATLAYDCMTIAPGPGSLLNRYSNFTTLPALTTLQRSSTVSFTILEDECDGSPYYSNGCAIWIDFNQDGDYTDAGEQVYSEAGTTISPRTITGTFTVPVDATLGNTAMRITVAEGYYGASLTPCLAYGYGETEDYRVNIDLAPSCIQPSSPQATAYGYQANVSWTEMGSAALWDVEFGPTPFAPTGNATPGYDNLSTPNAVLTGLTPSTGYAYYVRANCGSSTSAWTGPKNFTTTVSCPAPTLPVATGVTTTDALLNWTVNGLETAWDIEWGLAGFVAGSGTGYTEVLGTSTKPYLLSGILTPATAYDFYVRAACGVGDESAWVKGSFTTECNAFIAPFTEQFTSWPPACWNLTGGTYSWTQYNVTPVQCAKANFWGQLSGNTDVMTTPTIDVSGLTTPKLKFDWSHLYSASYPLDAMEVLVSDNNGTTWTQVWYKAGADLNSNDGAGNTTPGTFVSSGDIDLSAFGDLILIKFKGNSGYGPDLYVDNVQVYQPIFDKTLSLKVLLEGLYDGAGGLNQAYDELGPHFAAGIADQVTLELRNSSTGAVEFTMSNVNLGTDGMISATVPSVHNGSYYIYVHHRNSITTSTADPVSFAGSTISYDFSTGVSQAFGLNMKDLAGVAVVFAGDVNQDCGIDSSDLIDVDNDNAAFAIGYLATDIDGNGGIDSSDMIIVDNNNAAFVGCLLPF